ncbi:protein SOGA3a isoform X1 [Xyrauchen texanus]|uniref:protein SOGA3a isoform X1 n=2 Tax=Xyrauchen texanus TaxID=154827 RepID=UPI002241B8E8|nr:protein SOGA3a isoform X1 [Xyrauchen texanus]
MWNAFGNGSSGYVSKAQGWEFVPCSRLERGGKRVQSPARVRSFPSNHLEQRPPGHATAASDATCGQTPYLELQSQHPRLKNKFEELKKRYDQEKEEWRMEKEKLLRQVAEIQGGENRRILLDLKSVLEEVQSGVKREESKRSDLELQYMKDQCSWELERAELKSRITQLETRRCNVVVETVRSPELGGTLKREREEQKRLLADTHSAAMDLRFRLDNNERGWVKEKSELLERFDSERKEWENQLMDMQRKIEELYDEVKAHREGGALRPNTDPYNRALRLSSCSGSSLSSALTYPSDAQSNEYSEVLTQQSSASLDFPSQPSHNSCEFIDQGSNYQNELLNQQGTGKYELDEQQAIDTEELEELLESCLTKKIENKSCFIGQDDLLNPFKGFQSMEINCGSDIKKKNTALNAALKEIASVSEELCSYQDKMRKGPYIKRSHTESMVFPEEAGMVEEVKGKLEKDDAYVLLKNLSEDLKSIDEQYWMDWEGFNKKAKQTQSDAEPFVNRRQAPPIPARSTSWYLSSPSVAELEYSGTEALTSGGCQRPGIHQDRRYNSPAIVRKFEAMLQENEGKILDSVNVVCTMPVDSKCNGSCCQSRWSCDGRRLVSNKSSKYVPFKRCHSNVDIAAAEHSLNQIVSENNSDDLKGATHPMNLTHLPTDCATSLDIVSPYASASATHINERLEQKTAEFNRTLFQAGMGLQCDEDNCMNVSIDCGYAWSPSQPVSISKDSCTDSPSWYVQDNAKDVLSDLVAPPCPKEMNPDKSKQLKRETKDIVSNSSSLQQDGSLQELPVGQTDHAGIGHKDLSSMQDNEVKPLWTIHSPPSPVAQFYPSTKHFELSVTPPQMKIHKESPSKFFDFGTDQHQADTKSKQAKQDTCKTRSRILDENPWKPSTLAAYPRPLESRSNYGAVEKILKSYENMDRSQEQQQSQSSPGKEEDLMDLLEMLDIRHKSRSNQRLTHTPHHQVIAHKETHVTVQQSKESTVTIKKSFSRPACPAKRRLPSRWASRSSTSSASSPSPPPTTPPTVFTQQQTLTYSTYHTETVI